MDGDLARRLTHVGRLRLIFGAVSAIAAISFLVSFVCAVSILAGDHAAVQPILMDESEPFLPAGALPMLEVATSLVGRFAIVPVMLMWLIWLFNANWFVRKAGAEGMRFSPAMSVAWHFVPVMNHAMPLLVLAELEAATRRPRNWFELRPGQTGAAAWLIWQIAVTCLSVTVGLDAAETQRQYGTYLIWVSISSALLIAAIAQMNHFMRLLYRFQTDISRGSRSLSPGF